MTQIKLSDFIAKYLKEKYQVQHFFMVSGGGAMHLNDSLGHTIPYTANHHEQACAMAAEGYARVNRKLAVVNVTTGPGGLNCLNGVFGQWTDSVPVLYISGQVKYTTCMDSCKEIPLRQLGDQEVDIISCVKHLTKYAVTVFEPNEIKYHIDRAVYEATTGRFGPVWLNIPMNVQSALIDESELVEFEPDKTTSSPLEGEDVRRTGEGYNKNHRIYLPYVKNLARNLRKEQTPQEVKIWNFLRNSQTGYKFRRQHQFDNKYIADFVCLEKHLIIELDGSQHLESFNDTQRTFYLNDIGFDVIRFWNNEVNNNIEGCYKVILEELNTPHPNPLPQGARGHENLHISIKKVVQKLQNAKRPLIVAGHGIRLSGQLNKFRELVDILQIPVVETFNGCDILTTSNSYNIGKIGTIGQRAGNFALQNADLLLELGTRNNIRQISYNWENFGKNAYKIVVDIDKAELEKPLVKPDLAINADLADFIPALTGEIENTPHPTPHPQGTMEHRFHDISAWLGFCQKLKDKYSFENHPEHVQKTDEINPYYFTKCLTKRLTEQDTVVSANATPSICLFQVGEFNGQRVIMNSGDASMGFGLPAAIGASFQTEGRTIAFEGDGSVMMNLQELETIAYNNIPIKVFILNNSGYSSIQQTQKNFFNGRMTGCGADSGVGVPDFKKLADGFGIKSITIKNPATMDEEIQEVLDYDGPILCEVVIQKDYIFAPKLSSRKLEDGTMVSTSLEDMYPFLDRKEFEENIIK